jgi:hypothetical protein
MEINLDSSKKEVMTEEVLGDMYFNFNFNALLDSFNVCAT